MSYRKHILNLKSQFIFSKYVIGIVETKLNKSPLMEGDLELMNSESLALDLENTKEYHASSVNISL